MFEINAFLADIDKCSSNPCVNGQCVDSANHYTCTCDAGWIGTNCDEGKLLHHNTLFINSKRGFFKVCLSSCRY